MSETPNGRGEGYGYGSRRGGKGGGMVGRKDGGRSRETLDESQIIGGDAFFKPFSTMMLIFFFNIKN